MDYMVEQADLRELCQELKTNEVLLIAVQVAGPELTRLGHSRENLQARVLDAVRDATEGVSGASERLSQLDQEVLESIMNLRLWMRALDLSLPSGSYHDQAVLQTLGDLLEAAKALLRTPPEVAQSVQESVARVKAIAAIQGMRQAMGLMTVTKKLEQAIRNRE